MNEFVFDKQLDHIVDEQNGYLRIIDVQRRGISKYRILTYIRGTGMTKVGAGVYAVPGAQNDWMYYLQIRNRRIIFSYESAMYLNGLSSKEPANPTISVVRGYNAKHIKDKGVIVHTVPEEWFELGVTEGTTKFGNKVRIYDQDRCICDLIRRRSRIDPEVYREAITKYFTDETRNYDKLREYAKIMQMEDKLAQYTGEDI